MQHVILQANKFVCLPYVERDIHPCVYMNIRRSVYRIIGLLNVLLDYRLISHF